MSQFVNALFGQAIEKELSILRKPIEEIVKSMGGDDRSDSIELSLAKEEGEDGDEEVQFGHAQDLQRLRWGILDELKQKPTGVILVAGGVIDDGEIEAALLNSGLEVEGFGKSFFKKFDQRFLDVTDRDDIDIGHEWVDYFWILYFLILL